MLTLSPIVYTRNYNFKKYLYVIFSNGQFNMSPYDDSLDAMYVRMMRAIQLFRYPLYAPALGSLDAEALRYLGDVDARDFAFRVSRAVRSVAVHAISNCYLDA